jgi:hypothetical protein
LPSTFSTSSVIPQHRQPNVDAPFVAPTNTMRTRGVVAAIK